MDEVKDPRFKQIMTSAVKHLHALRARGPAHRGGMVRGHQVPHRGRPEVRRQAPGIHPALRHPRPVDDDRGAQPQDRAAARPRRRCSGRSSRTARKEFEYGADLREGATIKGEDVCVSGRVALDRRQAGAERHSRHLAGEGRRHVRRADRQRIRAARTRQGERQGRVRVQELQAEVLQRADRRSGRRSARTRWAPPDAPGAHARHRRRAGLPAGDHARVRRGRPVPRVRRGVRGQGLAGRQIQEGRRGGRGEAARLAEPVPPARLGHQACARRAPGRPARRSPRATACRPDRGTAQIIAPGEPAAWFAADAAPHRRGEATHGEVAQGPKIIRPDDIDPHHNWARPIQAPGHTQVDFEERVNFRRLHDYRLARVRAALAHSGPGRAAVLRPAQHPLHHQHRDRRMGARQAHALLAAHRQRRSLHLGLRLGGQAPSAVRAVAAPGPLPRRPAGHARCGRHRHRPVPRGREGDQGASSGRRRGGHAARAWTWSSPPCCSSCSGWASRCATASR